LGVENRYQAANLARQSGVMGQAPNLKKEIEAYPGQGPITNYSSPLKFPERLSRE
jgi:hypothetical protein